MVSPYHNCTQYFLGIRRLSKLASNDRDGFKNAAKVMSSNSRHNHKYQGLADFPAGPFSTCLTPNLVEIP